MADSNLSMSDPNRIPIGFQSDFNLSKADSNLSMAVSNLRMVDSNLSMADSNLRMADSNIYLRTRFHSELQGQLEA